MKKILVMVLAVAILAAAAVCAGAETADNAPAINGEIVDGAYVLTVRTNGDGEWRADEMAQDDTVVKLASAEERDGFFTARYEPSGDGAVTVSLRRYNGKNVCVEIHTFDLLVKNGKVQEVTGGSYTAAPDEWDVNEAISGEWLEKDTQFTTLTVNRNLDAGWNVEITSPVSHGAWKIRANVYYDCDYDALVYSDGVKYDLVPGDVTLEKEAAKDLWGTLGFSNADGGLEIVWYDMANTAGETVTFERAPGLPAYAYSGEDALEGAVTEMLAKDSRAEDYLTEKGYVTIPCPIIHKTEMLDGTHAKVYGSFWILNYVKRGEILENISGGEYAGVMDLEKDGDAWTVITFTTAGDGDDYAADIEQFAAGDSELAEKYFAAADLKEKANEEIRTRFIRDYVEANGLAVTAYRDYGWDPVPLK